MNKECEITRDLISLYIDHISSDASRDYVEEHVAHCPECKKS
ncbi:zf-HC2 domain-containing protein [Sharpea azabuensis]|nr:zf-HC2 domain-containing protein [Sharpea azabuensis]